VTAEKPENKREMVVKALAAATVSAVVTSLVITAVRDPSELSSGLIVFFFLYGIPIAGVAALTVGLPAHLLLSRFGVRSLMAYLIAGVIAAFVFGVWFERLPVTPHTVSWREVFRAAALALPGGLVAAAMFWRVAVRPRLTSRLPIDK
jgi:MFS family permease